MRKHRLPILLAAIAIFAAAIAGHNPPPDPTPPSAAPRGGSARVREGGGGAFTPSADQLLSRGRQVYDICASCHLPDGTGVAGINPPLSGPHVNDAPPGRLIRALMHGVTGVITIDGTEYDSAMPSAPVENDADIAAVLTYIRQSFGNTAPRVTPAMVAAVRTETKGREDPWTVEELDQIK